ncbi:MAG TPA: ABC transporter permease [Solirubrobacterales bacterium]|nr:ABC transporter permease [Solirubrobacterales bacterium]
MPLLAEPAVAEGGEPAKAPPARRHQASLLERFAGPGLLVVMFLAFTAMLPDTFPTYNNLIAVVNNQTITAMVALGLLVPLAAGVFDISIGGILTLSVIFSTLMFQATGGDMPVPLVILMTLGIGMLAGLFNGLLVVKLRIEPFIVTLGSGSVFIGISQLIANGQVVSQNIPRGFTDLGRGEPLGIPAPILYVGILALVLGYVFVMTPLGRKIYATGANREASRLAGVPTDRILFLAFMTSGVCASAAGLLYAMRIGAGQPEVGAQYLLPAYAAAFLGSTMIKPGRFNVLGLLIGLAIIAVGINGLQLNGIPSWVIPTFQGAALIVAVVLTKLRGRGR